MTTASEQSEPTLRAAIPTIVRLVAALAVLIAGLVHLQLYFSGYRNIPDVGRSFVLKGIASVVVAGVLIVRRDAVVRLAAAALAASTLVALALSRTDRGIFGFQERGLDPSPQTLITVLAEIVVLVAVAITFLPASGPGEPLQRRIAVPVLAALAAVSVGASAVWASPDGPSDAESATPTTEPTATTLHSPGTTSGPTTTVVDTVVDGPDTASTAPPSATSTAEDLTVAEPDTTEPESEPETAEPETAEPETAEPETAEPETAEPETTEPESTVRDDAVMVVSIVDFVFDEQDLEIPVGTTVRWVNDDSFAHSVLADDRSFASERMEPGDVFEFEFESAGQFDYICGLHPSMTASISVVG